MDRRQRNLPIQTPREKWSAQLREQSRLATTLDKPPADSQRTTVPKGNVQPGNEERTAEIVPLTPSQSAPAISSPQAEAPAKTGIIAEAANLMKAAPGTRTKMLKIIYEYQFHKKKHDRAALFTKLLLGLLLASVLCWVCIETYYLVSYTTKAVVSTVDPAGWWKRVSKPPRAPVYKKKVTTKKALKQRPATKAAIKKKVIKRKTTKKKAKTIYKKRSTSRQKARARNSRGTLPRHR